MPIRLRDISRRSDAEIAVHYREADAILYALSVGLGRDPVDGRQLRFVTSGSEPLQALPTMCATLIPDLFPADIGWNFSQVVHSEQRLQIFRPLPPSEEVTVTKRIAGVVDLGARAGAVVIVEAEGRRQSDDTALFTASSSLLARADGGFGGPRDGLPRPHRVPRREPDFSCELETRPDQALLYRLNGDWNPLHVDPAAALAAGFQRPILHGLCTFGVACHAILQTICEYDATLIRQFDGRFSAPVYPGDTVTTDMWQDGTEISFQCRVREDDRVVLRNGLCRLAA